PTSFAVGRKRARSAGTKPRRSRADTLQLRSADYSGPAAFGAPSGNGSVGDATIVDVRHKLGDATEAPRVTPCVPPRQAFASSQPLSKSAGQCCQSVEPGRARTAPIRRFHTSAGSSGPGHVGPDVARRSQGSRTDACRRKGDLDRAHRSIAP